MEVVEETGNPDGRVQYVEKVDEPHVKLEQPQNEAPAGDVHPPTSEPAADEIKVSPLAKYAYVLFFYGIVQEPPLFSPEGGGCGRSRNEGGAD